MSIQLFQHFRDQFEAMCRTIPESLTRTHLGKNVPETMRRQNAGNNASYIEHVRGSLVRHYLQANLWNEALADAWTFRIQRLSRLEIKKRVPSNRFKITYALKVRPDLKFTMTLEHIVDVSKVGLGNDTHAFRVLEFTIPMVKPEEATFVLSGRLASRNIHRFRFATVQYQVFYTKKFDDWAQRTLHTQVKIYGLDRKRVTYVRDFATYQRGEEEDLGYTPSFKWTTTVKGRNVLYVTDNRGKWTTATSARGQAIMRLAFSNGVRSEIEPLTKEDIQRAKTSKNVYYLKGHGRLRRDVFTVPKNVVLLFITLPGTIGFSRMETETSVSEMLNGTRRGRYYVIYTHGDTTHNMSYSSRDNITCTQRVPGFSKSYMNKRVMNKKKTVDDLGIVTMERHAQNEFTNYISSLSDLVNQAIKRVQPTDDDPLVVVVELCRSTDDSEVFESCMEMNADACQRMGRIIPRGVPRDLVSTISMGHFYFRKHDPLRQGVGSNTSAIAKKAAKRGVKRGRDNHV